MTRTFGMRCPKLSAAKHGINFPDPAQPTLLSQRPKNIVARSHTLSQLVSGPQGQC